MPMHSLVVSLFVYLGIFLNLWTFLKFVAPIHRQIFYVCVKIMFIWCIMGKFL
uniref:Uncharacterized protein n=1 Tax=Rhizophora mucronata TaxID=61149 RepID=A0A2P2R3J6_RHIMU